MALALTEDSAPRLSNLEPLWHRTAPRRLVEKCRASDWLAGWTIWQQHLVRRRQPLVPPVLGGKNPPLLWGWPENWGRPLVAERTRSPDSLSGALRGVSGWANDLPHALETVALAYALPDLAGDLSADAWWRLAEWLRDTALEAQQPHVEWPADADAAVRQQLLAGELPLVLGYLFPELRALRALREPARGALSEGLIALTDGEGLPHARLLEVLAPLFACWTRCRGIGERLKRGAWSSEAEVQYAWLVRHAVQLTDGRGQFLFRGSGEAADQSDLEPLFATALELVGDRGDCAAAAAMLPKTVLPRRAKPRHGDLPPPSLDSEWSGIAVLASNWSKTAPRLAVTYADEPMGIDLAVGGQRLFAGTITSSTTCDGRPVQVIDQWEQLCWHSDKRCDYLELGVDLTDGLRLERQLLLPREDDVLFVADIVHTGDGSARRLGHSLCLPLGPNIAWQPEAETRDGVLVGERLGAAVLPLALYEWRCDPRGGSLSEEAGRLTLAQEADGRALYCPLLFDLQRGRSKKQRTWRQLTVAESLAVVPRDVAVAFRAQSGRDQWVVYRSLAPPGNRTFIGQNVSGEFCAGRFPKSGEMEEWIEVETC